MSERYRPAATVWLLDPFHARVHEVLPRVSRNASVKYRAPDCSAMVVIAWWGESAVGRLLVATQVVLSLQLPFAIVPLVRYAASQRLMGSHASGRMTTVVAVAIAAVIVALNAVLVVRALTD